MVGAAKSLCFSEQLAGDSTSFMQYDLTPSGEAIVTEGKTPEFRLALHLAGLAEQKATLDELKAALPQEVVNNGMRYCQAMQWSKMDAGALSLKTTPTKDEMFDLLSLIATENAAGEITSLDENDKPLQKKLTDLKKRKCLTIVKVNLLTLKKGAKFGESKKEYQIDMNKDMVKLAQEDPTGAEEAKIQFRPLNYHSSGTLIENGSIHPLMTVRKKYKKVLLCMGFEEMKTDRWLESSFWNFDTLFQPQQHPARDSHDTFFIKSPAIAPESTFDPAYFDRVRLTHEFGDCDVQPPIASRGWRYPYSNAETCKNIMRTHTTACSSRQLFALAEEYKANVANGTWEPGYFPERKFFSIDRVFRNETLDYTHLAEFHQIEGLIAGKNKTLADLMSFMKTFYAKIGITGLVFKPAYNPYTEPSMEIFGQHNGKTMEVGNSGIFRPEMLRPMGLPEDVTVIAWGLGLDRMTMLRYNIKNIRDIFGYKSVVQL